MKGTSVSIRQLLAVLLLLSGRQVVFAWQHSDTAKFLDSSLTTSVASYSLDCDNALSAWLKVASDFHLPMGIEWIKPLDIDAHYSHSWQQTAVENILRDVVNSQAGYEWDLDDNRAVVHIRPAAFRGNSQDIVNARLGSFTVENEFVAVASRRLQGIAGAIMAPPEPSQVGAGEAGSIGTGMGDRKVSIKVENGTISDILDQLCLAADLKIWIVVYPAIQTRTAAGFLRTASLYSDLPIEDHWRPTWTFRGWIRAREVK